MILPPLFKSAQPVQQLSRTREWTLRESAYAVPLNSALRHHFGRYHETKHDMISMGKYVLVGKTVGCSGNRSILSLRYDVQRDLGPMWGEIVCLSDGPIVSPRRSDVGLLPEAARISAVAGARTRRSAPLRGVP